MTEAATKTAPKPGGITYDALGPDGVPTVKPPPWGNPTVGRIVHFRSKMGGETGSGRPYAAAVITWVHEGGRVNLMVFRDNENIVPFPNVSHESEDAVRNWAWPPQ